MNNYLHARPVNALKKVYTPAYLGAKIRASKANPSANRIAELAIKKRLNSEEGWAYKKIAVFKAVSPNEEIEYRDCLVPSPITAMAEAFILNAFGEKLTELRSKRVYSYLAGKPGSRHNYEYYLSSYEKRSADIHTALQQDTAKVAVFFDIKGFYASANAELMLSMLRSHPVFGHAENRYALDFAANQLANSPSGIPIGTDLSHAMADIYLKDLDSELESKLGDCYFRYVDDLTLVCKPTEVDHFSKLIENRLKDVGLQLNDNKFADLSPANWESEMNTAPVEGEDFYDFCQSLGAWMDQNPSKFHWLETALRNEGFQIPLERVFFQSFSTKDKTTDDKSPSDVIKAALDLRHQYKVALEALAEQISDDSTRWRLQKAKRAINPLFYLLDKSDYKLISSASETNRMLRSQQELALAVAKRSCDQLLSYPGATVNTFCELWRTAGDGQIIDISKERLETTAELEAATALALHRISSPHADVEKTPIWRALKPGVSACTDGLPDFESELESLRIGLDPAKQQVHLQSRLVAVEDIHLSALELGNQTLSP